MPSRAWTSRNEAKRQSALGSLDPVQAGTGLRLLDNKAEDHETPHRGSATVRVLPHEIECPGIASGMLLGRKTAHAELHPAPAGADHSDRHRHLHLCVRLCARAAA